MPKLTKINYDIIGISTEELIEAIKHIKKDKCEGGDGLSANILCTDYKNLFKYLR